MCVTPQISLLSIAEGDRIRGLGAVQAGDSMLGRESGKRRR